MHRTRFAVLCLALLLAAAPAFAEKVDKDTPSTTPGGATFTVPAGWSTTTKANMVVLDTPEPDSHVALVDTALNLGRGQKPAEQRSKASVPERPSS